MVRALKVRTASLTPDDVRIWARVSPNPMKLGIGGPLKKVSGKQDRSDGKLMDKARARTVFVIEVKRRQSRRRSNVDVLLFRGAPLERQGFFSRKGDS
jgi:hypothetical protein